MPIQRLKPNNDFRIEIVNGHPKQVTIALAVTDLFRATDIHLGFITGKGGRDVILNQQRRHSLENILPGASAVIIRNFGPEIVDISWA